MKRSFYEILGVAHDADASAIAAAYAQATQRVNSDIKRGAAEATMEAQLVRDGYQILSDQAKRARYDAKLSAAEHGVKLMFFPEDKNAKFKLGMQTVVFAVLAVTFVGVMFWQMNRKISEVRADYQTVVVNKQAAQVAPKVVEEVPVDRSWAKADPNAPKVSDMPKGETVIKITDVVSSDANAKGAPDSQAKR